MFSKIFWNPWGLRTISTDIFSSCLALKHPWLLVLGRCGLTGCLDVGCIKWGHWNLLLSVSPALPHPLLLSLPSVTSKWNSCLLIPLYNTDLDFLTVPRSNHQQPKSLGRSIVQSLRLTKAQEKPLCYEDSSHLTGNCAQFNPKGTGYVQRKPVCLICSLDIHTLFWDFLGTKAHSKQQCIYFVPINTTHFWRESWA